MVEVVLPRTSRRTWIALGGIVVLAAGLRAWGLWFGLPNGYARPDETYIIDVVLPVLDGRTPPANYEYPWLYMWASAIAYLAYFAVGVVTGTFHSLADLTASWREDYEPLFLINRGLTALAGTCTVVAVFAVARRLWSEAAGLVAAAALAVAYLHVRDSHYGTTDVTMTLLVVLAVAALLRAHDQPSTRAFAAAGALSGLAMATKYTAVFLLAPALIVWLLDVRRGSGGHRLRRAGGRLLAVAVPMLVAILAGMPFVFTDPGGLLVNLRDLMWSTVNGQAHHSARPGWLTHLQLSLRFGVGVLLLAAAGVGAGVALWRDRARAVVLLAFPATYFAVAGAARNQYFRYMVPLVPFLSMVAGGAVHYLRDALQRRGGATAGGANLVAFAMTLLLLAVPAGRSLLFDRALAATDSRVIAADWIADHVPAGSSVLVTGSHYGHPWLPADLDYGVWAWDQRERRYHRRDGVEEALPEWILRQESPLSSDRPVIDEYLRQGYVVAWRLTAMREDRSRTFDLMDAFYLPYAGFPGVTRPGPNFTLFRRGDVAERVATKARPPRKRRRS